MPATPEQHADPNWLPLPQYWVDRAATDRHRLGWALGFKDITSPTNVRSMIAALLPAVGFSNKLPVLLPEDALSVDDYRRLAPLLVALLNSLPFDFVVRQKVHGQTLNLFLLEQLPVLPPSTFDAHLAGSPLAAFVRGEILRLTYTAVDMEPFARDMGYAGPPFRWDDEDRRHRMARLDALFFHLYGLGRDDAAYVLDQFPIVREDDERRFGRYRTRDLVLAYMNAVAAGDLETVVQG